MALEELTSGKRKVTFQLVQRKRNMVISTCRIHSPSDSTDISVPPSAVQHLDTTFSLLLSFSVKILLVYKDQEELDKRSCEWSEKFEKKCMVRQFISFSSELACVPVFYDLWFLCCFISHRLTSDSNPSSKVSILGKLFYVT